MLPGEIVKLHQGELDFLVAWIGVQLALVRPDDLHEVVHVAQHHVEKGALARGAGIGDGRLQQMAGAVKLVAIAEVLEAVFRFLDGVVAVEIAVGLLGLSQQGNDLVAICLQGRIGMVDEGIGSGFQPLGKIRILKHHAVELPGLQTGSHAEIVDAAALFRSLDFIVEGLPLVG